MSVINKAMKIKLFFLFFSFFLLLQGERSPGGSVIWIQLQWRKEQKEPKDTWNLFPKDVKRGIKPSRTSGFCRRGLAKKARNDEGR